MLAAISASIRQHAPMGTLTPLGNVRTAAIQAKNCSKPSYGQCCLGSSYRGYAKQFKKASNFKPYNSEESSFHLSKSYRPTVPTRHSLIDDQAAQQAYKEAEESKKTGGIMSIEALRRKVNAKKNVEKVIKELSSENEDPLIRQAYEELEDEDRIRRGLAPLKRAPPGKLKTGWQSE